MEKTVGYVIGKNKNQFDLTHNVIVTTDNPSATKTDPTVIDNGIFNQARFYSKKIHYLPDSDKKLIDVANMASGNFSDT